MPPIGIIVADVFFSVQPNLRTCRFYATLVFGLLVYAVMLPLMIYRLIFSHRSAWRSKPTIAIMAAPASLFFSWLPNGDGKILRQWSQATSWVLVSVDDVYYLHRVFQTTSSAFQPWLCGVYIPNRLVQRRYSNWRLGCKLLVWETHYVDQVFNLAYLELIVATFVVGYVAVRYYMNYKPHRVLSAVGCRL